MRELSIAICGAGFMGGVHAVRLSAIPGVRVAAVCDTMLQKAEGLASKHGAVPYADFSQLLSSERVDAVYICLPPFAHSGEAELAAECGAAVFLEKPIALTKERAWSMHEAIKRHKRVSQVGYHMRFGGAVQKLKKLIDNGAAGKPCFYDARFACNNADSPWWCDVDKSGGQVLEMAIHTYDMAMYLLGVPSEVMGMMGNVAHTDMEGYTVEDVSAAVLRFKNGALGSISATNCAIPMQWDNPFYLSFENLTADFKDPNHAEFVYIEGGRTKREVKRETLEFNDIDMYGEEDKHFVACVRENRATGCSAQDGLQGLLLVQSVIMSAKMGGKCVKCVE